LNYLEIQGKLINPNLVTSEFVLKQVGAGQYEMTTPADQPGAYLVWLGIKNDQEPMGQLNLGLVVPFSPEYRSGGVNYGLLEELARVTGGSLLEQPVKAFIHNLPALDSSREIWQILLLITALLFPIDVVLRRLVVTQRDIGAAKVWVLERINKVKKPVERQGPQIFNALFAASDRAKKSVEIHTVRTEATLQPRFLQGSASENLNGDNNPPATKQEPLISELEEKPNQTSQDSFSRLREAKRRARKQ